MMPVMPIEPGRISDITDVSVSQWILHYGYAMPVMSAGESRYRHRRNHKRRDKRGILHDIVDVFGGHRRNRKRLGKPQDTV